MQSSARTLACVVVAGMLAMAAAQQPGHQKSNKQPIITTSTCTTSGGCTQSQNPVQLDSNWMWTHKVGTYTNCFTGNSWDAELCPTPEACAKNCALDAGDYDTTYGITGEGDTLKLAYVVKEQQGGTDVGSRTYLMEDPYNYKMFKLLNQEFTFDVDVSTLPCGVNGALYFVEMQQDGGLSEYAGNNAGAAYGTGYCDAQCPQDIKFINGEANILDWKPTSGSTGVGSFGTCCVEMDIWEANSISTAVTPHPCRVDGQTKCTGIQCANGPGQRYDGACDKDGGDWNPYRLGDTTFYGPGSDFKVDTTQKMTVITQFHTDDGTANGNLVEIKRLYRQNGVTIKEEDVTVDGKQFGGITEAYVNATKVEFKNTNSFAQKGGMEAVSGALSRGMVLVMSIWDDNAAHMLWLDSDYPTNLPPSQPGVARGTCSTSSGVPSTTEQKYPNAFVAYSNIKVGDIGSTFDSKSN